MIFRELEQLADRIFIFPRDTTPDVIQPNIGVIRLEQQTVLIDAGNSLRHARQIRAAMAGLNFQPIDTILYTHHHWDHTFAGVSYNATTIVGHDYCDDYLVEYARRTWNTTTLRDAIYANPRLEVSYNAMMDAITDWSGFRIKRPSMTFSQHLQLHLEDMLIELEYVGGRHAKDSVIIKLPQYGIMFLGDAYYPPPFSEREDGDENLDLTMLNHWLDERYDIYIDGHGAPRNYKEFEMMIEQETTRQNKINHR